MQRYLPPCADYVNCHRLDDDAHCSKFAHMCRARSACPQWKAPDHYERFDHPPRSDCADAGCTAYRSDFAHQLQYRHPCPNGPECALKRSPRHVLFFTHNLPHCKCPKVGDVRHALQHVHVCPLGSQCHMREHPVHVELFSHPELGICPTPYNAACTCGMLHVCPHGSQCTKKRDPGHAGVFIHTAAMCGHPADCAEPPEHAHHLSAAHVCPHALREDGTVSCIERAVGSAPRGRAGKEERDAAIDHLECFVHLPPKCKHGRRCEIQDPAHRGCFRHPCRDGR